MSNIYIFQKTSGHDYNRHKTVSIRGKDLAFNSRFVKDADIGSYDLVSVYLNDRNFDKVNKLFFKFHNDATASNTFNLRPVNSNKKYQSWGKVFTCGSLINSIPRLKILSSTKQRNKKSLKIEFDSTEKLWSCDMPPNFEFRARHPREIDESFKGIYKLTIEGRTQYYGRGIISKRVKEHIINGYDFDQIHYSLEEDSDLQTELETKYLDEFENQFGKLPTYNQIRGFNSVVIEENSNKLPNLITNQLGAKAG